MSPAFFEKPLPLWEFAFLEDTGREFSSCP